jgi:intracellular sulfur oxidation DsrE/DsrF family protein
MIKAKKNYQLAGLLLISIMQLFLLSTAMADVDEGATKNKIVIQVSTDDPKTQNIALNNAVNLQKEYGLDNITIELVAYGPGLGLLTQESKQAGRVKSLALQNIHFSACGNTMAKIAKKTGKQPQLVEGVQVVKAGVSRIMELQQNGYAYVRP